MKTSELIQRLEEEIDRNGDREMFVRAEGQYSSIDAKMICSADEINYPGWSTLIDID